MTITKLTLLKILPYSYIYFSIKLVFSGDTEFIIETKNSLNEKNIYGVEQPCRCCTFLLDL